MTHKIVVTGGEGFIGSTIIQQALSRKLMVTSFDIKRSSSKAVASYQGDILDLDTLHEIFKGQDCVIHCAANPNLWSRSKKNIYQVNTQGTLNVIKACQKQNVSTLIHISSDCTLISKSNNILQEHSSTHLKEMKGAYCKSKWLAEKAVLDAHSDLLRTIVINPGVPVGPTQQMAPFTQLLEAFIKGKVKGYCQGQIGLVDVQDLAQLALQALEHGQGGHRYIAVAQVLKIHDLFTLIGQSAKMKAPHFCVPIWLAKLAAFFEQNFAMISGASPLATLAGIHLAQHTRVIDASWTQRQLQIEFKNIEPALDAMVKQIQLNS